MQTKLINGDRPITVLDTFTANGTPYAAVLIPYSATERLCARKPKCCHLQVVRMDRLDDRHGKTIRATD